MRKSHKIKKGSAVTNKHSTKPKKRQHLNGLDTNNTLLSVGFSGKLKPFSYEADFIEKGK